MKKLILGWISAAGFLAGVLTETGWGVPRTDLLSIYKKGEIRIVSDPEFGKETDCSAQTSLADRYRAGRIILRADEDWTSNLPADQLFESRGDIAVAPDGSVFVSNTTRHTIFKFDRDGKFIKAFGRPGQGPGDLTNPGRLSVLDGKYVVVGESATTRRISLFDLDGTFVKIISTGRYAGRPIALGRGKIAYIYIGGRMEQAEMVNLEDVVIIDGATGAQKTVIRHEFKHPLVKIGPRGSTMIWTGTIIMDATRDGGLVVGTTRDARMDLFSADGLKVGTIDTGWKALPVTSEYRARLKSFYQRQAEEQGRKPSTADPVLPDRLEILQNVWTDSEGNILVCKKTECLEGCPLVFRAYSPKGDFLSDFEIAPGPFVLSADWRFRRIALTDRGLFGLLEFINDPDGFLHLVRTAFQP